MPATTSPNYSPPAKRCSQQPSDRWIQNSWIPLVRGIATTGTVSFLRTLLIVNAEHPLFAELHTASFASAADPFADMADYHRSIHRWLQQLIRDGLTHDVCSRRENTTNEFAAYR